MRAQEMGFHSSPVRLLLFSTAFFGSSWDSPTTDMRTAIVKGIEYVIDVTMCRRVRSVFCVDTSFGNYLRLHDSQGHAMARKCYYICTQQTGIENHFHTRGAAELIQVSGLKGFRRSRARQRLERLITLTTSNILARLEVRT